jgi:type IV pilus assembly protein PilO
MAGIPSMDSTPRTQKLTLGMVMVGLVVCGFYLFVWEPIHSRTERVRGDLQRLGQEIQHYETQRVDLNELQARIKELEKSLYGENQTLLQEFGHVGLRNRVTGMAKKHQLGITYWQPEAFVEGSRDGIKKTPIRVQIEGGYHQVAKFFTRVLHLPEVFDISHFTIGVTDDQTQNLHLQTNFVMTRLAPPLLGEVSKAVHHLSNEDSQHAGL